MNQPIHPPQPCVICHLPGADDTKDGIPIHRKCWWWLVEDQGGEKAREIVRNNHTPP